MNIFSRFNFSMFISELILAKCGKGSKYESIKVCIICVYAFQWRDFSSEFVTLSDLQSSRRIDSCWMDYGVHIRSQRSRAQKAASLWKTGNSRHESGDVSGLQTLYFRHLAFNQVRVAERSDHRKCKWNCIIKERRELQRSKIVVSQINVCVENNALLRIMAATRIWWTDSFKHSI